jgi:hypothetical protein
LIERYETNPNIRLDRTWKITSNQYYQHWYQRSQFRRELVCTHRTLTVR